MKLSVSALDLFLLLFTMIAFPIPHTLYLVLRYVALAYLFLKYFRYTAKRRDILYLLIASYGIVLLYSTWQNNMRINNIISAFSYIIQIIDTYLVVCSSKKDMAFKTSSIFKILLIFAIITDVMIVALPYDYSAPAVQYFVGTKFTVCYLHCFLICLYEYYDKNWGVKYKPIYYILFIGSTVVSLIVKCSTGTILCGIVLVLHFLPNKVRKCLCSWQMVAIISVVIIALLFSEMTILNNESFINMIARVFNKNVNLTGRTYIFRYLPIIIARKPYIGYGYYNTMVADYMGTVAANPQNGFMKIVVDSGFVGLVFYLGFMFLSIAKGVKYYEKQYPLFIYFYAMLFVSSIEINLTGGLFFLIMAIIFASSIEEESTKRENVLNIRKKKKHFRHVVLRS